MIVEGHVGGFARDVDSKRPDAVGNMACDTATQADKKANHAPGQAHDLYGQIVDEIRQYMTDRPFDDRLPYFAPLISIVACGSIKQREISALSTAEPRRITMLKRSLLAASVSAIAAGCAYPTAPAAGGQLSVRAVPEQLGSVMLCVTNPNSDALVFRQVTVALDRAGTPLATGSSSAEIVVPAFSATRVSLSVLAIGQDRPGQRGGWLRSRDVNYRVDGSVSLDRAFGLNISYRHSGHLDVVSSSINGVLSRCAGSDVAVPL